MILTSSGAVTGIPDYLGQFIHETGENLLNALLRNEASEVQALFAPLLMGTLFIFERLKPSDPSFDVWTEQKLQIAAAPVIDLLELSGFSKLLAELHAEEKLWVPITTTWQALLSKSPHMLTWLAAITAGGLPRFQIPHRGLVRTNWSMRVQRELNQLPRRSFLVRGSGLFTEEEVHHPSPLVRYCAKYEFHDGWEIFAAVYLSKQPGGEELRWGHGVANLAEALEREDEEYTRGDNEDAEEP